MRIAMTGTSGNMGREVLAQTMEVGAVEFVRVLLSNKKRNEKLAKKLKRKYGERIQIVRGSIGDKSNCEKLVEGTDLVVHLAGVIPPASDANHRASEVCNLKGTCLIIDAIKAQNPQPKYIHISTVAVYGGRNEKHPFGRVGDPLLTSPYDTYAMHKLRGERYCLEAGLDNFVVLRQTAMLHPNMLMDNVSDGLMFHTALNAPLEWVSARDSGFLIRRIVERDMGSEIPQFWNNIYNIASGMRGRVTGLDTFNDGFALIGGSAEKFFKPNWFANRNFHGMWFYDANELEELFHYQRDGVHEYWQEIGRHHKIMALGKIVPAKLIDIFLFQKLLKHPNSPRRWVKDGDVARATAMFGGLEKAEALSTDWKEHKLMARGDFGDYDEMRKEENAKLLDHGYDESKQLSELSVEELGRAAAFRGGALLSQSYCGDAYKKLMWKCHAGHEFEASPFTVLRGGHWCPECCQPTPWQFGEIAKHSPFVAQVWYDANDPAENYAYGYNEEGKAVLIPSEAEA